MKLIGRTLIILAAALVVAGATFAYGQSGYAGGRESFAERGVQAQQAGQPAPGADRGDFRRGGPGGREHDRGPSLFGIGEIVKDLLIIGVIVAAVALATRGLRGRRDRAPAMQE